MAAQASCETFFFFWGKNFKKIVVIFFCMRTFSFFKNQQGFYFLSSLQKPTKRKQLLSFLLYARIYAQPS